MNAVQPVFAGGDDDAFVAKLSAHGSTLIYSTYLGGNSSDYNHGGGIADSNPARGPGFFFLGTRFL